VTVFAIVCQTMNFVKFSFNVSAREKWLK